MLVISDNPEIALMTPISINLYLVSTSESVSVIDLLVLGTPPSSILKNSLFCAPSISLCPDPTLLSYMYTGVVGNVQLLGFKSSSSNLNTKL